MDFRGLVWKRVWKITFFGLKSGQDLKNRAAYPHQEFPGVPPGYHVRHFRLQLCEIVWNCCMHNKSKGLYGIDSYKNCLYLVSRFSRPFVCFSHYFYWELGLSGGRKRRPEVRLRPQAKGPRINLHDWWKFASANSTVPILKLSEKTYYTFMFIFIKSDERGIACSKTEICIKGMSIVNECSGLVAPTLSESWLILAVDWSFT